MSKSNQFISDALTYQDLERIRYAQNLRANPALYKAHIEDRTAKIEQEIIGRKEATFAKANIDLARYMDMEHNANYYRLRSGDVERLVKEMREKNEGIEAAVTRDKTLSRRQFEINEWFNYNKLETLFFLQVLFICALIMAIIIHYQKNGMLTNAMASLVTLILVVIVAGVALYRYSYTRNTRDPRLWHRRYFGAAEKPKKPTDTCGAPQPATIDLDALENTGKCIDEKTNNFNKWKSGIQNEILEYQTMGKRPSFIGENIQICNSS